MREMPEKAFGRPDPIAFGRSLQSGIGLNLLVSDIEAMARFLNSVLGIEIGYWDDDFAICNGFGSLFMLHHDRTYRNHPYRGVIDSKNERGAGIEIRLYGCDPDQAVAKADTANLDQIAVLDPAANKPHGVREAYIVGPDNYVWVPTIPDNLRVDIDA